MKTNLLFALLLSLACTLNLSAQDLTSASSPDVKVTTVKPGNGDKPTAGQDFFIHVDVSGPDGSSIFSTRDMNVPIHGTIGKDSDPESIALDKAMQEKMQRGGTYRLEVPKEILKDKEQAASLNGDHIVYEVELISFSDSKPSGVDLIKQTLLSQGTDAAQDKFAQLKSGSLKGYVTAEWDMNAAGYDMLKEKKTDAAITLFQMNTELNPGSWNAYDSLGDGYLAKQDKAKAKAAFEQALKLNPDYTASKDKLSKL